MATPIGNASTTKIEVEGLKTRSKRVALLAIMIVRVVRSSSTLRVCRLEGEGLRAVRRPAASIQDCKVFQANVVDECGATGRLKSKFPITSLIPAQLSTKYADRKPAAERCCRETNHPASAASFARLVDK